MIRLASETIAVLGGALLLLAACSKLGGPRGALAETLSALGVPAALAVRLPVPLGMAELAAAAAVVLERGVLATGLVTALAVLFLGAGLAGLRSGMDIACHCLGSGRGRLGWTQVALFPFWLLAAGLPFVPGFAAAGGPERWLAFVVTVTLAAAILFSRLARPALAARALRLAVGPLK